ncbi:MAG: hypothetical protein KAT79_01925, partial [candidate division Zixibacteria bacterium]|nr:hypothetical protein [candidate division Zixibacteria bacterium]
MIASNTRAMLTLFAILTIISVLPTLASAQSEYFDRGQGGTGVGVAYISRGESDGLGASISVSAGRALDVGIAYARLCRRQQTAESFGPSFTWYWVKHYSADANFFFAARFGVQRESVSYKTYFSRASGIEMAYRAGLGAALNLIPRSPLFVQLAVSGFYVDLISTGYEADFMSNYEISLCSR